MDRHAYNKQAKFRERDKCSLKHVKHGGGSFTVYADSDSQSNTIYPKKSIYLENQKEHIAGMATSVVQLCDKSQMWH